jgi:hypothetical protein
MRKTTGNAGLAEARAERERSERALRETTEQVTRPLQQMRAENHITPMVIRLMRGGGRGAAQG